VTKASARLTERLNSRWLRKATIVLIVFSVTLAGILYWIAGKRAKTALAEQMLYREMVVARAGAKSIESFIELVSDTLLTLDYEIAVAGEDSQVVLSDFIEEWRNTPVASVLLTDEEGVVKFSANKFAEPAVEDSIAQRKYFSWAKEAEEDEVFIGEPVLSDFEALKNRYIVTLTTPIRRDGEFKGLVSVGILLSELAETYLEPLKVSENNRIYLVNSGGVILQAPYEKFIGVDYLDHLSHKSFEGVEEATEQLAESVEEAQVSRLTLVLPDERSGGLTRFLIAQAPVKLDGSHWTLGVATPVEDAFVCFWWFHGPQVLALTLFVFIVLGITMVGILTIRVTQREAYIDGFTRGRDHKGKRS
jgi:hypothetical protein